MKWEKKKTIKRPRQAGPRWKDKLFDKDMFEEIMNNSVVNNGSAEDMSHDLIRATTAACDASMPRRTSSNRGAPCYWWTEEIKTLRAACLKARRRTQRSRRREDFEARLEALRLARRKLKQAIKESKTTCFKRICNEADINPWGTAYRMVMTKLKGYKSPQISCPMMLKTIVEHLFPRRPSSTCNIIREGTEEEIPAITTEELFRACRRVGDRKAPGPDGIPNTALKTAVQKRPDIFKATLQKCLEEGVFPESWKLQHLVLLPKGKKPPGEPSSYRPICLLDTMGKILERIIYERLLAVAEEKDALSDLQFGFRKSRSTVNAIKMVVDIAAEAIQGERWRFGTKEYCAVVTLDIKNAFNSADWSFIRRTLVRMDTPYYLRKIVANYLTNRKLRYETDEGLKYYNVSAGVPQGSVLGPLLWNIMYDGVLRLPLPPGVKIIGFADDIAVVTVAKYTHEIETATNEAICRIKNWLVTAGLELADHKTEAVLITSRKVPEYVNIQVGTSKIKSKDAIKYLGVMLDNRLNFKSHVESMSKKASGIQAALCRILPNIGGPGYARRILLSRVVSSVLLYAAPVWAKALTTKAIRHKLTSVYRLCALRTISGFRTISDEAAFVIAGMVPIDILADEMLRIYIRRLPHPQDAAAARIIKEEERSTSLANWQNRWDRATKGRWTYKLIPKIDVWTSRGHGDCNYHLTQFLSGHGGYRKYLYRFGHDTSPLCPECPEEEETTEHAIFHCRRFSNWRAALHSPSSIIDYMLLSEESWTEIGAYITNVQIELRRIEKIRKAAEAEEAATAHAR